MTLEYLAPTSLAEACALGREPGAVFMAGGTDVLAARADGRLRPAGVISLRGLPELRQRRWEGEWLHLGAGFTHAEVADDAEMRRIFPALAQACRTVGSWSIRVLGTLGGNVCTAAPSADSAGPLLAYGAEVEVSGPDTARVLPLGAFFIGAGKTVLQPGEILTAFRLPHPGAHGGSFLKFSRRKAMEIALVSATALVRLDEEGAFADLRLALGTAGPTPMLLAGATETVHGRHLDDALRAEVSALASAQARPRSGSFRCDADYRRRMVGVVAGRALASAWENAVSERGRA